VQDEGRAERIRSTCMRRGLILATQGWRLLLPALTIPAAVAERGLDILDASSRT
jgi:4-aminobutyrate aminotransferase-like enzyme